MYNRTRNTRQRYKDNDKEYSGGQVKENAREVGWRS